jgi:glyoxylase I family protein
MTYVHHIGITVSDIETSLEFYAGLLCGERLGPWDRSGPYVDRVTGHPGVHRYWCPRGQRRSYLL